MKPDEVLDSGLEELVGTAAPALRDWGVTRGLRWTLACHLTEGQSGAVVALVFEQDQHAGATKLLMKMYNWPNVELEESEFPRHRAALREAPPGFAQQHLTPLANEGHDLVRVGDGRWIVFQRIAAMPVEGMDETTEIQDFDVLSKALESISANGPVPVTGTSTMEPVACAPDVFVRFCGRVTRVVLRDWAGKPDLERMTGAEYLREHLLNRLDKGRPLSIISRRLEHDWLLIGDDPEPLPNPFILLRKSGPGASLQVMALLGRAHGDLHTGNLLAPVTTLTEDAPFRLIDLAKYSSRAPLARDPAGLLLYIVVRVLRDLNETQQQAIGELLLCHGKERHKWAKKVPTWLADLEAQVRGAAEHWAHQYVELSQRDDWRPQWRLSLIGYALILLGRRSTRTADRMWLLRFAARATRSALGQANLPARTGETAAVPEMLTVASPLAEAAEPNIEIQRGASCPTRLPQPRAQPPVVTSATGKIDTRDLVRRIGRCALALTLGTLAVIDVNLILGDGVSERGTPTVVQPMSIDRPNSGVVPHCVKMTGSIARGVKSKGYFLAQREVYGGPWHLTEIFVVDGNGRWIGPTWFGGPEGSENVDFEVLVVHLTEDEIQALPSPEKVGDLRSWELEDLPGVHYSSTMVVTRDDHPRPGEWECKKFMSAV